MHIGAEVDHVNGMEPPAVGVKEGHDLEGQHLSVEGVGVLEFVVPDPDSVHGFVEKFGGLALGRLVTGIGIEADFVSRFRTDANNRGGIVGNAAIVEQQVDGMDKGGAAMVGDIPCGICEEGHEGMDPPKLIVGDLHEDRE